MPVRLTGWPPLPPDVYVRRPRARLPYPLDEPDCSVLAWARHGIHRGVRALGLRQGDVVLVPAYNHGSEVEALLRAGLTCRFYDTDATLEPSDSGLENLVDDRVRALYVTHHLGFPQDGAYWRAWCDDHRMLLIEDAAQAWLSERDGVPVGARADLAVYCLYKTFGLAEGAAVRLRGGPLPIRDDPRIGAVELARRHGRWAIGRWPAAAGARTVIRRRTPAPPDPSGEFDLRDPAAGPWRHTDFVLRRIADPATAEVRRTNYETLLGRLRAAVPPAFRTLVPGASPFLFPVQVTDKPRAVAALDRAGVAAVDLWTHRHPAVPAGGYPQAALLRESVVGLPVHQHLRPRDLRLIAEAAEAVVARA